MRFFHLVSFSLLAAFGTCAWGQISEQTLNVTGHGPTAESAKRAALVEAIRQANEVFVSSEQKTDSNTQDAGDIKRLSVATNGLQNTTEGIDNRASFSEITAENIGIRTKGVISRYKVVSEEQSDGKQWNCELEVVCPVYSSPSKDREPLRSIAVAPFAIGPLVEVQKDGLSGSELGSILAQAISEKLTQSRKFRILDRTYAELVELEAKFIREKGQLREIVRFGKAVGADYLLVGTIREYSSRWTERRIEVLQTVEPEYSCAFTIEYRLVETATSEIRMSNTLQIQGGQEALSASGVVDSNRPYLAFARSMGGRVCEELLENVYPIMVMAVNGPSAI